MRSSLNERWSAWKYSTERSVAPHVEETWAETFVVELRLQGVSGAVIGEALTEVESHCAESGESARDAFGDATEYARRLGLPRSEDDTITAIAAATAPTVVQVVGMLATLWAFAAWAAEEALDLTTGQVLSAVILLGVIAGIVSFSEQTLRFVVAHPVGAFFAFFAFSTLAAVVPLLLQYPLATVPAGPVLAVSGTILVGGTVWQWSRTRSGATEDLLTSPLDAPPAAPRRSSRWAALTHLVIPLFTGLSLALSWWIAQQ